MSIVSSVVDFAWPKSLKKKYIYKDGHQGKDPFPWLIYQ
jgi:hypothetical protein